MLFGFPEKTKTPCSAIICYNLAKLRASSIYIYIYFSNNIKLDRGSARAHSPKPPAPAPSPSPEPEPRAPSPEPEPEPRARAPSGHLFLGPLWGSLLSANATIARNPCLTRHFSRQNVVYCSFSKKERVFPDWSSLFGPFLGYFQKRNAIFVDFEERNAGHFWFIFEEGTP